MAKDGELRRQFGAFMRTAMHQLDSVREVVVQKSKAGRIQLDVAMLRRKRKDALADLGAAALALAVAGKLTEDDFPELSSPLAALEALDERIAAEEDRARRVGGGDEETAAEPVEEEDTLDREDGSG